jgi:S-DNA-T family DNA segregation ATPase FtsK/SpoIIIE
MRRVMDGGHLVLLVLGLLALGWLIPRLLFFVLADWPTRRSMWQAWRIRRGWVRVSRIQGLTVTDPVPPLWARLVEHSRKLVVLIVVVVIAIIALARLIGSQAALVASVLLMLVMVLSYGRARLGHREKASVSRVLVPRIRVRADSYGVIVTAKTLPKVGRDEWVKAAPHLANAWGCVRVAVTQDKPGRLRVRAVRRDPLTEACERVPSGLVPADLDRWEIGRDEYAELVTVRLSNVPGVCVAGLPGYGKTSAINGLLADFAPSPAVQFAVVDGKGGADYEDLEHRFFAFSGDDLEVANGVFKRLYELRRQRAARIRAALGVKNMWHVGPSPAWPLVLLVIDEAHTFLAEIKGDKRLTELVLENRRLVEDLVKKGRSVGICVILATQKSTGDAIPTAIRDVCPVALSFAQRTDEAAVAALGADIRQFPEANPVSLQDPAYVGVASMVVQGRPGFVRVRTPYVKEGDVARICEDSASLTRDPTVLLSEGIWNALPSLDSEEPEASQRGEDRSGEAAEDDADRDEEIVA